MSTAAGTFKLYIGNLYNANPDELQALFQDYGKVIEIVVKGDNGFVHMETESQGREAIRHLNGYVFNTHFMKVAPADNYGPPHIQTIKLFVGNLSKNLRASHLRDIFAKYGTVVECNVFDTYGFVHLDAQVDMNAVIRDLNGKMVKWSTVGHLTLKYSLIRPKPGMGESVCTCTCGAQRCGARIIYLVHSGPRMHRRHMGSQLRTVQPSVSGINSSVEQAIKSTVEEQSPLRTVQSSVIKPCSSGDQVNRSSGEQVNHSSGEQVNLSSHEKRNRSSQELYKLRAKNILEWIASSEHPTVQPSVIKACSSGIQNNHSSGEQVNLSSGEQGNRCFGICEG
ncbi:hypothetical protein HA402_016066 [Bradysia odoriphaga]|nr:hypothetical protein HA402_016066 [Bradysia odoriphaga]